MSERPIIFSGPMVRAILDGQKTETRRPMKPQPYGLSRKWSGRAHEISVGGVDHRCPYGQPGDLLWVRETWAVGEQHDATRPRDLPQPLFRWHKCDYVGTGKPLDGYVGHDPISGDNPGRWRSPIHMPRWASRMTLRVVEVRVELLHAIADDEDALEAEGFDPFCCNGRLCACGGMPYCAEFAETWDDMYFGGPFAWSENPWVWVVRFAFPCVLCGVAVDDGSGAELCSPCCGGEKHAPGSMP